MLAAYTGLRASELLRLSATPSRCVSVRVEAGKTGHPRTVPIVGLLRPHLAALPLGLSYWQLHKAFCAAREKAGMPHVRFHDLRHTTASLLINAGVDLYTVGAILGHRSTQTTARYAHLADKTLRAAMRKIG
jgi:integrase